MAHRIEHAQYRRLGSLDVQPPGCQLRQPLRGHVAHPDQVPLQADELTGKIVVLPRP